MIDLRRCTFEDHPDNPLIVPPGREFLIADPTVVAPNQAPDNVFHLFAHSLRGIHHYTSLDGVAWEKVGGALFPGIRPYLFVQDGYHLFYERFERPWRSVVAVRSSTDLKTWSEPRTLLRPKLSWEGRVLRTNSNPCVVKTDGQYRLYYAANWVLLRDCWYIIEPKFIGVAQSEMLLGPYEKRPDPIIIPSADVPWRNLGAGSLKVIAPQDDRPWLGLNNGIYIDEQGRSRSDIRLLESEDGLSWRPANDAPLVSPEPGWKRALVYAMHACFYESKVYLYFNARDGWAKGVERIGMAVGTPMTS